MQQIHYKWSAAAFDAIQKTGKQSERDSIFSKFKDTVENTSIRT
jgi:hypothetical protein